MIAMFGALDAQVLETLFSLRVPVLTEFFLYLTQLGDWLIIYEIAAAASILLLLHRRKADAAGLAFSVLFAGAVILFSKLLIARPRPPLEYQAYLEMLNYSLPSAHAGLAMALYAYLAYLLLQTYSTPMRRLLFLSLPLLVFLVGFSRLYLGVHYFSDVFFGYIFGGIAVWMGIELRRRLL